SHVDSHQVVRFAPGMVRLTSCFLSSSVRGGLISREGRLRSLMPWWSKGGGRAHKRIALLHADPEQPHSIEYHWTIGWALSGPDRNHSRRRHDAEDHSLPVVQRPSGRGSPLLYLHLQERQHRRDHSLRRG